MVVCIDATVKLIETNFYHEQRKLYYYLITKGKPAHASMSPIHKPISLDRLQQDQIGNVADLEQLLQFLISSKLAC
jgi:hypothetical protein